MINKIKYIFLIVVSVLALSCEDVIDVDANFQEPQLVIDAWINSNNESQIIRLTNSQNYFDSLYAQGVTGAIVKVIKNNFDTYIFEDMGNGNYVWTPNENENIGAIGDQFALEVVNKDILYSANTQIKRTALLDSIAVEYKIDELGYDDGYYIEAFARDQPGIGDSYWIKAYKNDTLNNKPQEISLTFDGTFDPGSNFDGQGFISPIRESVNRISDDNGFEPYNLGDKVRVEIHSVSNDAFKYMRIVQEQIVNGDNTIFAIPVANARGNITNTITGNKALGFFNVAAIVQGTVTIE